MTLFIDDENFRYAFTQTQSPPEYFWKCPKRSEISDLYYQKLMEKNWENLFIYVLTI